MGHNDLSGSAWLIHRVKDGGQSGEGRRLRRSYVEDDLGVFEQGLRREENVGTGEGRVGKGFERRIEHGAG